MLCIVRLAASRMAFMFSRVWWVCDSILVPEIFPVFGSNGPWAEMNRKPSDTTPCEYGPLGCGAFGDVTNCAGVLVHLWAQAPGLRLKGFPSCLVFSGILSFHFWRKDRSSVCSLKSSGSMCGISSMIGYQRLHLGQVISPELISSFSSNTSNSSGKNLSIGQANMSISFLFNAEPSCEHDEALTQIYHFRESCL